MSCHDCGQPLPLRPWGRHNGKVLEPLCTLCMVRWRGARRGSARLAVIGWIALAVLCVAIVVAVLGAK